MNYLSIIEEKSQPSTSDVGPGTSIEDKLFLGMLFVLTCGKHSEAHWEHSDGKVASECHVLLHL